jgi:hypothetical protein
MRGETAKANGRRKCIAESLIDMQTDDLLLAELF